MKTLLNEILSQWTKSKKNSRETSNEMEHSVRCFIDGYSIQYGYHFLGLLKYFGIGMVEDRKQGFAYISKSSSENVVDSAAWMAVLYLIEDSEYDIVASMQGSIEHLNRLKKLTKTIEDKNERHFYKKFISLLECLIYGNRKQKGKNGKKRKKFESYNELLSQTKELAKRYDNQQYSLLLKKLKLARNTVSNDMITFS